MDEVRESEPTSKPSGTTVEQRGGRELVVTRTINGPARLVFEAWTQPELLQQWWVPRSFRASLLSCEAEARVGGKYRLVFRVEGGEMAFFGTYLEVTPHSRLVWTNEEAGDAGQVTTVTFEESAGKTRVVLSDLYPSKEALALGAGSVDALPEAFDQLDALVATLGAGRTSTIAT